MPRLFVLACGLVYLAPAEIGEISPVRPDPDPVVGAVRAAPVAATHAVVDDVVVVSELHDEDGRLIGVELHGVEPPEDAPAAASPPQRLAMVTR